jgi:hypothetical protein
VIGVADAIPSVRAIARLIHRQRAVLATPLAVPAG